MSTANDEHLSVDEIAKYVEAEERATADGGQIEQYAAHLDNCSICRTEIAMEKKQRARLRVLRASTLRQGRSKSCPATEEWANLAAGLAGKAAADRLLHHASECDACAAELRNISECFSDSLTDDEQQMLGGLRTSGKDWKEEFVQRLTRKSHGSYFPAPHLAAWVGVAAAALVVVAIWWITRPSSVAHTAGLLAQAYSEERQFDLRLPGARQAPLQVKRGAEFKRPEALLEAELRIQRAVRAPQPNPEWLDLDGRADLLELKPRAAIDSLTRAASVSDGNADIDADLGCAYALRGELENEPTDYQKALQYFSDALRKQPHFAAAAFNQALVYEKLKLYNQAEETWRAYLSLEPDSAWSNEARSRLADIEKKKLAGAH